MVLLGMAYSLVLAAFGLAVLLSKLRRLGDLIRIEAIGVALAMAAMASSVCLESMILKHVETCKVNMLKDVVK